MIREIQLTQGFVTIVDDDKYESLNQWKWHFNNGYAVTAVNGKTTHMQRLIMKAQPGQICDHIDRNKLNNRRSNLRFVSATGNVLNRVFSLKSSTGYIGVHRVRWRGECGWIARCSKKHIGTYSTPEEAARARDEAAVAIYGPECVVLNFPMERSLCHET